MDFHFQDLEAQSSISGLSGSSSTGSNVLSGSSTFCDFVIQDQKVVNTMPERSIELSEPDAKHDLRSSPQAAIYGFAIVFGVIFGILLLTINIHDQKGQWSIVGFGTILTISAIVVLNRIPSSRSLTLFLDVVGSQLFNVLFLNKFRRPEKKLRKQQPV